MWAQGQADASTPTSRVNTCNGLGGRGPALLLKCKPRVPQGVGDSSLTLGGSLRVCPLTVLSWGGRGRLLRTPSAPPTLSVMQGGGRARRPEGRGGAGGHQLCWAKGGAVVHVQKYLKGGVTGQALASTPGTALEQHHRRRDFVPPRGEETPAWGPCWVVKATGQRPQLQPLQPLKSGPDEGQGSGEPLPPTALFWGGGEGGRMEKDVFPANLIESEET